MSKITQMRKFTHSDLPGVVVFSLTPKPSFNEPQELLVELKGDGEIPLHSHSVDAEMYIVAGDATVLSDDGSLNGRNVKRGDVVHFERNIKHGFKASESGLVFVSRNGGIVDAGSNSWDIDFR